MTAVQHDEADALTFDFAIDEPPQKVWHALTDPQLVERWLAPIIHGDAFSHSGFSCEKLGANEGRAVSYLWRDPDCGDSVVTFSLTERADGFSRLSVLHEAPVQQPVAAMRGATACSLAFGKPGKALTPANQADFPPLLLAA